MALPFYILKHQTDDASLEEKKARAMEPCLYETHKYIDNAWIKRRKPVSCKNYFCNRIHAVIRPNPCPEQQCGDPFCRLLHPNVALVETH